MFGPSDALYLSRWRRRIAWLMASSFPLIVAWQSIWAWLEREARGVGIPVGAVGAGRRRQCVRVVLLQLGLLHRSQPIVQAADPEVKWGAVFYFTASGGGSR